MGFKLIHITTGTPVHYPCKVPLLQMSYNRRFYVHMKMLCYYDVMTWKSFLYRWPFVRGIHWSAIDSPRKGPLVRSFVISFVINFNKLLIKQPRCWLRKVPYRPCDITVMTCFRSLFQARWSASITSASCTDVRRLRSYQKVYVTSVTASWTGMSSTPAGESSRPNWPPKTPRTKSLDPFQYKDYIFPL